MGIPATTTQTMDLADARQRFGEVVAQVSRREARFLVEENGTPVAAIVSTDDLRRLELVEAEREQRFEAMREFSRAFADVPVDELERRVGLAVAEARADLRAERAAGQE